MKEIDYQAMQVYNHLTRKFANNRDSFSEKEFEEILLVIQFLDKEFDFII